MKKKPPSILGIASFTVFLDIVGFSILFPLFPSILDWYLIGEGTQSLLGQLTITLEKLANNNKIAVYTLFGGMLGSIYGLLQFIFSVIWGSLSDSLGRRPILLVTLAGTIASYLLWAFSGSFTLLVASRILSGIMAGNIATASAAVADTTTDRTRAKGMGLIGMSIGLGFVIGPTIGGLLINTPIEGHQGQPSLSLHPFSPAAFASLILAITNFTWVLMRFPETLPKENRIQNKRSLNPFLPLKNLNNPGVKTANILYLIFLTAFTAVEFTLTFLAVERLNYSPFDLALIFIFVGIIIAIVQGGIVRSMAPKIGELKLTKIGLACNVPAFLFLANAYHEITLYVGLFFMALGSGLVSPCLSALVSRYCPPQRQGLAMGGFRAMGSLSRSIGPIIGATLYWKFTSSSPYLVAAGIILIPLLMTTRLPDPNTTSTPNK